MTFMAAILAVALLVGCAGGPDELELGYGHLFSGDSSLEGWELANDDSDLFTVGLVWKLRPTEVIVRNPVTPPVRWTLEPDPTTSSGQGLVPLQPVVVPQQDPQEAALEEIAEEAGDIADSLEVFDAFGTVTKIGFFLLAGLVLWTYRERLGRLIPGGNGKKKG